ncbi:MAG: hypothetical protein JOY71_31330, partial [Acetobacteraceae bacterium]|nr:hypothetical protein [Acetobacteraceae bacterium]
AGLRAQGLELIAAILGDPHRLRRCGDHRRTGHDGPRNLALVEDGRLCRFTASITDRPGGLAGLAQLIAATGASVKDISHDRVFAGPDMSSVRVVCTVETADRAHRDVLLAALREAGVPLELETGVSDPT